MDEFKNFFYIISPGELACVGIFVEVTDEASKGVFLHPLFSVL